MRGKTAFNLIIAVLFVLAWGGNSIGKTPPQGKMVKYPSDGEMVRGYLVTPPGKGPFPAVIAIHEWWGLNDQIKSTAKRIASQGYVVLAVDLYRGVATSDPGEAHELMRGLPEDRALRDMLAAERYLKSLPNVNGARIGSIGWCMGGGYSLTLAINSPDLAACVIYYGRLVTDTAELGRIKAPVLAFFGDRDRGIPPASVHKFENTLKGMGKEVDARVYPGAGHAFANETRPSYNEAAASDAWARTLGFFAAHLKK